MNGFDSPARYEHSKQHAISRDVTDPQDGHILNCDPYQATCGFSLRILPSSRIANSAINRPKKMLIAFIKAPQFGLILFPSKMPSLTPDLLR